MFDFGHEKRVQRKFEQLDALNGDINKNTIMLNQLLDQIDIITARYPELTEMEALTKFFQELKSDIAIKEQRLAELNQEIAIKETLKSLAEVRYELEEEQARLKRIRSTSYEPAKVLIVTYYSEENKHTSFTNAFIPESKLKFTDNSGYSHEYQVYVNLSGDRRIAISSKSYYTGQTNNENKPINAIPTSYYTLTEACQQVNSSIYLKERVSAQDLHDLLVEYLKFQEEAERLRKENSVPSRIRRFIENIGE